jgi:hypothetical protein
LRWNAEFIRDRLALDIALNAAAECQRPIGPRRILQTLPQRQFIRQFRKMPGLPRLLSQNGEWVVVQLFPPTDSAVDAWGDFRR